MDEDRIIDDSSQTDAKNGMIGSGHRFFNWEIWNSTSSPMEQCCLGSYVGGPVTSIESCEHCNSKGAEIPFDNVLDRVTGSDPSVTDYVLEVPAKCPNCSRDILEKTLIEPA
jgi:hypothetical protein